MQLVHMLVLFAYGVLSHSNHHASACNRETRDTRIKSNDNDDVYIIADKLTDTNADDESHPLFIPFFRDGNRKSITVEDNDQTNSDKSENYPPVYLIIPEETEEFKSRAESMRKHEKISDVVLSDLDTEVVKKEAGVNSLHASLDSTKKQPKEGIWAWRGKKGVGNAPGYEIKTKQGIWERIGKKGVGKAGDYERMTNDRSRNVVSAKRKVTMNLDKAYDKKREFFLQRDVGKMIAKRFRKVHTLSDQKRDARKRSGRESIHGR